MSAAVAAIQFALEDDDDGMTFLRLWNEGEFDVLRREWPEAPDAVYIGADQFHPETQVEGSDAGIALFFKTDERFDIETLLQAGRAANAYIADRAATVAKEGGLSRDAVKEIHSAVLAIKPNPADSKERQFMFNSAIHSAAATVARFAFDATPKPEASAATVELAKHTQQAGETEANDICQLPPDGWYCTRKAGHDGPCAARQHEPDRELDADDHASIAQAMTRLAAPISKDTGKGEEDHVPTEAEVQSAEAKLYADLTADAMEMGYDGIPAALEALRAARTPARVGSIGELPPLEQDIYMVEQSMLECEPEDQRAWSRVKAVIVRAAQPEAAPRNAGGGDGRVAVGAERAHARNDREHRRL